MDAMLKLVDFNQQTYKVYLNEKYKNDELGKRTTKLGDESVPSHFGNAKKQRIDSLYSFGTCFTISKSPRFEESMADAF